MFEIEKKKFAKCLVDGMEDMKAAFEVFPTDGKERMKAANLWRKDSEVQAHVKELLGVTEPEKVLPTKEEHIGELYEIFRDGEVGVRERLVASEQISRMQGFIVEKTEKNTTINNKILIIPRSGTDEEWERSIKKQQEELVANTLVIKEIDVTEIDEKENET